MSTYSSFLKIYDDFQPKNIKFDGDLLELKGLRAKTNLFLYGEIHGVKENADIVYTLCRELGIKELAIECSSKTGAFIKSAIVGKPDFSLVDVDMFDASILSLEMTKSIVTLIKEKVVDKLIYIDTFYDEPEEINHDETSPPRREQKLAENILNLKLASPTLCIMGQWHTKIEPITHQDATGNNADDSEGPHYSALYRVRLKKPRAVSINNVYRAGNLRNAGRSIVIPLNEELPSSHIVLLSDAWNNFKLVVPRATKISLP